MIWAILICVLWNIGNAVHDAKRIKASKKINHAVNAGLYIALVFGCCLLFDCLGFGLGLFCIRPLVFDNALNLFRGLPLTYVSPVPQSEVDKAEKALFGKYEWAISNGIYFLLLITNIVLIKITT